MKNKQHLLIFINVDWYFQLHWQHRANTLLSQGHTVSLVTNFSDKNIQLQLEKRGFCCHHLQLARKSVNPFALLKAIVVFLQLIRKTKPDLIHCITVKPNLIGGVVARFLNIPVIFSVTGLGSAFSSSTLKSFVAQKIIVTLFRWVAQRQNHRIIFENTDDIQVFQQYKIGHQNSRIVIKGAGVNINEFSFREIPHEKTSPIILFGARMLWDKGIGDLLEAADILRKRGQKFSIQVAGILDTDNQNRISENQILHWHDAGLIQWLGQRNDMAKLIGNASLVVLPTTYGEGIPRILIEAAAVGRPLIGSDVSGVREIIRNGYNGILVPPTAPNRLADAIAEILGDHHKQVQFGRHGRRLVEKQFAEEKVIAETCDVYRKLLISSEEG